MQNADTSYTNWTLPDLKQAASTSKLESLATAVSCFNAGDAACQEAAASFMTQVKALGSGWQGTAAQAASDNATSTHQSLVQMQRGSKQASTSTTHYDDSARTKRSQVEAIPNVDTSMGHAVSSGWWAGPVGVGVAAAQHQAQYDHNQKQAARVVTQMDSDGRAQSASMRSINWPTGPTSSSEPPSSIPPVPGSGGGSGN